MTPAIERGGIFSGQISTIIKIVTCVSPHQKHLKRTTNSTYQLDHCGVQGESLRPCPESTLDARSLSDTRNCQVPLRHPQLPGLSQPHLSEIIHLDIQLGRNYPTSRKPWPHNKGLPRRLLPPRWIQLSGRISDLRNQLRQITPTF